MKKIMMILMIAIGVSTVVFAQNKMAKDKNNSVETQVIALEKASWQEWKNKNSAWFQTNLSEDFLSVHNDGVTNKAQIVKSIAADCEVKSFSFDNFKFVMLTKDSAMMTYTAMQDAVCNGKTIPANVFESVVYVKRGGKWLQALYTEIPAAQ
jgi:predicted small secreted protein